MRSRRAVRERQRARVAEHEKVSRHVAAQKKKTAAPHDEGAEFAISGRSDKAKVAEIISKHQGMLSRLPEMDDKKFLNVCTEVAERHAGHHPTENDLVGTFLEVLGAIHSEVAAIRTEMINNSLHAAVASVASGVDSFYGRSISKEMIGGALSLDLLPWKGGEPPSIPRRDRFKSDEAYERAWAKCLQQIDQEAILHLRDLAIGDQFADRATVLKLTNGKCIVLLTEEYKSRRSGKARAQSTKRDGRVFEVFRKGGATLTAVLDDPDQLRAKIMGGKSGPAVEVKIAVDDIIFNAATFSQDQLITKATSGDTSVHWEAFVKSKSYREAAAMYSLPIGSAKKAVHAAHLVYLNYPSAEIRAFIKDLRRLRR